MIAPAARARRSDGAGASSAPSTEKAAAAPALRADGLRKEYGASVAVDRLDLEVPPGQVHGLLGPNGAGKTTTVKMLLGLTRPTAGRAWIFGIAPEEPAARGVVGFLPEHFRFPPWLSAWEVLELHGRLYGMPASAVEARAAELLARVGLDDRRRDAVGGFSKGMLQRLGLAQALLNGPSVVVLDEPTSGLDPFGRMLVRDVIHELAAAGTAVLLNSHLLGEVEAVCDRIVIMDRGRVAYAGVPGAIPGASTELARVTLLEMQRRRLVWVMVGLGVAYLALFGTGLWFINREFGRSAPMLGRTAAMSMLLAAGLYVIQFLTLVMAAIISVDALSGEIASGTIQPLATKPIRRRDIVLGKALGHSIAVAVFVALMGGGAAAIARAIAGVRPPNLVAPLALISLEGIVVVALAYAGGAVTGTLANGLIVFMLYALALVGSWIERIGTFLGNTSAQYLGIAASLIMPTEAVWQRAAWTLLPPLLRSTIGLASPFTAANPPSRAMVVYAIGYAAGALALAVLAFDRRDL